MDVIFSVKIGIVFMNLFSRTKVAVTFEFVAIQK